MIYDRLVYTNSVADADIGEFLNEWGYEKPCLIGQGAFARVYRVKECSTGRFLACKVSLEQEMLRKESLILQQAEHPLFPTFYDFRQKKGIGFLFMEYVPGRNLRTLIRGRGKMTQRQAVRIGMALAEGLCYLHELRTPIIFRDLKPENIVIREDGEVKLLDFGSAARGDASRDVITGTDGYAAPEQWTDAGNVGGYSDVYALGKVLYFILGEGKIQWDLARLLEDCVQTEMKERIPTMRCFLNRLRRRGRFRKKENEYSFQQNVVKF